MPRVPICDECDESIDTENQEYVLTRASGYGGDVDDYYAHLKCYDAMKAEEPKEGEQIRTKLLCSERSRS